MFDRVLNIPLLFFKFFDFFPNDGTFTFLNTTTETSL